MEEEQRSRDESREQLLTSEKRCVALNNEKEDLLHTLESVTLSYLHDLHLVIIRSFIRIVRS